MAKHCERTGYLEVQTLGKTKKLIKVGGISGKYDILKVEEKQVALIENKTKWVLKMTQWQGELEARLLKAVKMRITKQI